MQNSHMHSYGTEEPKKSRSSDPPPRIPSLWFFVYFTEGLDMLKIYYGNYITVMEISTFVLLTFCGPLLTMSTLEGN